MNRSATGHGDRKAEISIPVLIILYFFLIVCPLHYEALQAEIVCFVCCWISSTLESICHSKSTQLVEWMSKKKVNGVRTGRRVKPAFQHQLFYLSIAWYFWASFFSFTKKMFRTKLCLSSTHALSPLGLWNLINLWNWVHCQMLSNVPLTSPQKPKVQERRQWSGAILSFWIPIHFTTRKKSTGS